MKTAVVRVIEGSARFPVFPSGEPPLKFVGADDCQFAIELEDDEKMTNLDVTAVPNLNRVAPLVNGNGETINVQTAVYAFRALAVTVVDKSAEEVMADIAAQQAADEEQS